MPPLPKNKNIIRLPFLISLALIIFLGTSTQAAHAATYYVDFDGGSDTNDGLDISTPFKHAPGDSNATGNASRTLTPGDTVLLKGGVHYKGSITVNASGTSGNPITYKGDGWGTGKAIIDGSDPVTGWTACADAPSCGNNSNWQHIYHATIPSIPSFLASTPEIRINVIQDGLPITTAQIPESTSRYYQETSTYYSVAPSNVTTTTITDSRLAALGGASLVGSYVYIWRSPNDVSFVKISAYDSGTNTITFPTTSVYTTKNTLYAIANYMGDTVFNQEGQYYFNPTPNGGGTYDLYVWPLGDIDLTTTGEITTSVRSLGISINAKDYVTIEGFLIEKQAGDSIGEAIGIYQNNSSRATNVIINNNELTLANGTDYGSIFFQWGDIATISNNYVHDTLGNMRGIQAGNATQITISGNQVSNISRTGIYFGNADNSDIFGNTVTDIFSSHGNGITVYQGSDDIDVYNNVVRNSNINYTMENSSNVRSYNNILDGYNVTSYVVADWGSMSGANTFMNNTIVNSNSNSALQIAGGGTSSWIIENNIIDGGKVTYTGAGVTYANNIYTGLSHFQDSRYGWALSSGESVVTNQDTIFQSPSSNDYRLLAGSPAIDTGLNLSSYLTDDLYGTSRPQGSGFDIGAHEFVTVVGDTTAPVLSAGSPSGVLTSGTTSTSLSLTTNESASCKYSTAPGTTYSSMNTFATSGTTTHSTTITGLTDGVTYQYYVKCQDTSSNTNTSDYLITFSIGSDTIPPIISGVFESGITTTSAIIRWTTNESASSQVQYSTIQDDYSDQTTLNSSLVTTHSETLTGLTINTPYYYQVVSLDAAGNRSVSAAGTFTTLAANDTTAPIISAINASAGTTTATISWTTDEIATPLINYGTTTSYGDTANSTTFTLSPALTLTGLSPSTTYHYQLVATDPSDNVTTSVDYTFTTEADTEVAPAVDATLDVGTVKLQFMDDAFRLMRNMKPKVVGETVTLKGDANDFSGGTVKIRVDGDTLGTADIKGDGEWQKKVSFKNSGKADISFVYELNGDEKTRKYPVKVDRKDPEIDSIPSLLNKKVGSRVYWSASDNDEIDSYKYEFNGKKVKTNKGEFYVPKGTAPGTYPLVIRAYDKAGNSDRADTTIRVRL